MALTIRLSEQEEKLIQKLKEQLGEASASKALIKAAGIVTEDYLEVKDQLEELRRLHESLHYDFNAIMELFIQRHNLDIKIHSAISKHL